VESETDFTAHSRRAIGWRDVLAPIGAVAGLFAACILLVVVAVFAATLSGTSRAAVHAVLTGMKTGFWYNNLLGDFLYAGLLLFMLWWIRRLDRRSLIAGFAAPPVPQLAAAIVIGLVFAALTILLISKLQTHHLVIFHQTARDRLLVSHNPAQLLALLVLVSLFAPLTEELYFRNILLSVLRRAWGLLPAILVSGGLFALVHFQFISNPGAAGWVATIVIFGLGVINALWVARTGFLWLAVASHAAYNTVLIVLPFALRH
jgi:membrane protease YdiL (CAAX protease family)